MSKKWGRQGRRAALASAVSMAVVLMLASCVFPVPTGSAPKSSGSTRTQATQGQSTQAQSTPSEQASSPGAPSPTESATAGPSGTAGTNSGGFGSMSEACVSVSAAMVSVAILPLAGLLGGKPEDVAKAKEELAKLQGRVPDELKPHFAKLKAFTDSAGSDFSKYGTGEFEALMKPIQDWLDQNCS